PCTTLLFLAGCGFSSQAGAPGAPIGPIDAPAAEDAASGSSNDAAVCVAGVVDVCGMPDPTMAFDVSTAATLNTDSDARCQTVTLAGHAICLIYATEVTIASTGMVVIESASITVGGQISANGGAGGGGAAGVIRLIGKTVLDGSMISPLPS